MELPIRIAILDSVALSRDCLSRSLRAAGVTIVGEYADERLFLGGLGDDRPELAIVDVTHVQDPLSLMREARQFHPNVQLLVLATGASADGVERLVDCGAAGYLDKLTAGMESVLEGARAIVRGDRVVPADYLSSLFAPRDDHGRQSLLRDLSTREREVLSCIAAGADNLQISSHLHISERTVKAHVSSLYRKLGQRNRTQLALLARQVGVRPPDSLPTSGSGRVQNVAIP